MAIVEAEVSVFKQLYMHECGTEVVFTGEVLTSNPLQYVHLCRKCDERVTLAHKFPRLNYKEKAHV